MRSPNEHSGDIGLVVAAVWMMVSGAWIALAGSFSIAFALVVAGALAIGGVLAVTSLGKHGR